MFLINIYRTIIFKNNFYFIFNTPYLKILISYDIIKVERSVHMIKKILPLFIFAFLLI